MIFLLICDSPALAGKGRGWGSIGASTAPPLTPRRKNGEGNSKRRGSPEPEAKQGLSQRVRRRPTAGEQHRKRGACPPGGAWGTQQRIDPARDRRGGIDERDRPRRERGEPIRQQRKVGAGEHDLIGAPISSRHEARRDLAGDFVRADGCAAKGLASLRAGGYLDAWNSPPCSYGEGLGAVEAPDRTHPRRLPARGGEGSPMERPPRCARMLDNPSGSPIIASPTS